MSDTTKAKPAPGRRNVGSYVPFSEVPPERAAEEFHGKNIAEGLVTLQDNRQPAPTGPMTKAEAEAERDIINQRSLKLRDRIVRFHDRDGWKALGYKSWEACVQGEFLESRGSIFRALAAGQVEAEMGAGTSLRSETGTEPLSLSDGALLELKKTPKARREEVLNQAESRAGGAPITPARIREAWGMIQMSEVFGAKPPPPEPEPSRTDLDLTEPESEWDPPRIVVPDLPASLGTVAEWEPPCTCPTCGQPWQRAA